MHSSILAVWFDGWQQEARKLVACCMGGSKGLTVKYIAHSQCKIFHTELKILSTISQVACLATTSKVKSLLVAITVHQSSSCSAKFEHKVAGSMTVYKLEQLQTESSRLPCFLIPIALDRQEPRAWVAQLCVGMLLLLHPCSIKVFLPSLYPQRHSRD